MGSFDVQQFLSFIQADGYEPLTVEAVVFLYNSEKEAAEAAKAVTDDPISEEGKAEFGAFGCRWIPVCIHFS